MHENRPEIMKFYPHLQKFPGKFMISSTKWKIKEEEFINKANAVVVVTEEAKNEIVNRVGKFEKNIVVVPNTVHKAYYNKAEIEQKITPAFSSSFWNVVPSDTESNTASTATLRPSAGMSSAPSTPARIICSFSGMPSFS